MAAQLAVEGGVAHCSYKRSVSTMTAQREAAEQEALGVLAKEVCQWLSQTLDLSVIPRSLMDGLETGVELCKLAELIQLKATESVKAGEKLDFKVSSVPIQCHKGAKKRSFHARENTKYFIEWCKSLGISDDLIFESNGLVEHSNEKGVILCLLEVSRYARKVHIKPPKIVEIEHNIDEGEKNIHNPMGELVSESDDETKNLDQEVRTSVKRCKCPTKKLTFARDEKRPMLGKYVISGGKIRDKKIIHVRRLSNTIMVRVGGGWVTLDHFLLDHDPCRVEELK